MTVRDHAGEQEMVLPELGERNWCVIGAGDALKTFLAAFRSTRRNSKISLVVSDAELDQSWSVENQTPIETICAEARLKFADVSEGSTLSYITLSDVNCALVIGWREIFAQEFFDHFSGMILNYHVGDLPRYQGAGAASWQILNGRSDVCVTIHRMTPKIDHGEIILQRWSGAPDPHMTPVVFGKKVFQLNRDMVFPELCDIIESDAAVRLTPQKANDRTYFPMLTTAQNGLIDFAWNPDEVEQFVRSFSLPYEGASFHYRDATYRVLKAEIRSSEAFHPFCQGLITNLVEDGIDVIVRDGIVRFSEIQTSDGKPVNADEFRNGGRVYNTPDDLMNAKLYRRSSTKR